MKKYLLTVIAILVGASLASAGNLDSYSASGTAGASVIIPARSGQPVAYSFNYSVATAATMTVYRPDIMGEAQFAADGSTNVYIKSSADGKVVGYTITTSDFIVFPATADSNAVLADVTAVWTNGSDTNLYIRVGFAAVTTVVSNGPVYVAKNSKSQSVALPAGSAVGNAGVWSGVDGKPVVLSVPATAGATVISGSVEYR